MADQRKRAPVLLAGSLETWALADGACLRPAAATEAFAAPGSVSTGLRQVPHQSLFLVEGGVSFAILSFFFSLGLGLKPR